MIEEIKCRKCKATMKSRENLNDDSVCETCIKLGIKNKNEKAITKEEEEVTNNIKRQIEITLEEYGIIKRCVCGKLYYKRSPAQKSCGECKYKD